MHHIDKVAAHVGDEVARAEGWPSEQKLNWSVHRFADDARPHVGGHADLRV